MNDRKQANSTLESVIMHIASRFINVPLNEYESRLNEALELIGRFLDIDRVYMFAYDFENYTTSNLFEWCNEGVQPEIDNLQNVSIDDIFDEWLTMHLNKQMVIYEDVDALDHDSRIYQILKPQGIISICTIPLISHNDCLGFVGFDDVREKRKWSDNDFKLLTVLSELIVNTMIKQRNDETLNILRENAIQANQAKSRFLAHMSHEIRTPLNGIHNAFYLLSQSNSEQEKQDYIQIAQTSLDYLTSIVNNVLDITRIEAGKMSVNYNKVDLEYEIVKTLRSLRLSMRQKSLRCIFDFDYSISNIVIIDMQKLNQILINLVNNAIKYTQDGYIKVSVQIKKDGMLSNLLISVEDNGVGISFEDQKRITEAFFQSTSQSSSVVGSGLGLSIVNQLVELMGGKLKITSTPHVGSIFEITLPFVLGDSITAEKMYKKIMILTDDEAFYNKYHLFFEDFADHVVQYSNVSPTDICDLMIVDDQIMQFNTDKVEQIFDLFQQTQKIMITDNKQKKSSMANVLETPISKKDFAQFVKNRLTESIENFQTSKLYHGHVLVVDDNKINREALNAIISKHGINCHLAASGYQAIDMCKINRYDLILMDIQMPLIDGYETAMHIRASQSYQDRTPIVAITANVFLSEYDNKMATHIEHILFKPIKIDELLSHFDRYLKNAVTQNIPTSLLYVNVNTIEEIFMGNYRSAIVMIEQFLKDCYHDIESIKTAIQSKDLRNIHRSLHYFKGPLSYFGAERMLYLIDVLMKNNEQKKEISVSEYQQLYVELNHFIHEIKGVTHDLSHR